MKKLLYLWILLPLFAFAQAEQKSCCEPKPCCEPKTCCEIDPCSNVDLFAKCESAYVTQAEFLYWTAQESNLTYALTQTHPVWATPASYGQGEYERTKFDFDPGFRINLGYFNAPKFYHAYGQYTWMSISGSDSSKKPSEAGLYLDGTWPYLFDDVLKNADSHIRMTMNLADVIAARYFFPNPHLRLGMLGGFTGGRLDQKWKIHYESVGGYESFLKHKWRFTGLGARLGLDIDWFWFHDFYLTGKATVAGVLGKYRNRVLHTTTSSQAGRDPSIPGRDTKYEDYRMLCNLQFQVGPSWQKSFCHCRAEVFAGYELNSWLNVHEIYRETASLAPNPKGAINTNSLLTMHGLVVRLRMDF